MIMKKVCKNCGIKESPYYYKNLCQKCFSQQIENNLNQQIEIKSNFLINEYVIENKSIRKISLENKLTTSKIRKYLLLYRIPIERKKNSFNEKIFSKMSAQGAFLLGYIFTDGDFLLNKKTNQYFLRIYSKHITQIEKLKKILKTDAKIQKREQKNYGDSVQTKIYFIHIGNQIIINDLLKFGLTIEKNLNVKFPKLEDKFKSHFLRGCWAGSGNVTIYEDRVYSSIVIGSYKFISEIEKYLSSNGLKPRKIYKNKLSKKPSYVIKYAHGESEKLYNFLYKGKTNLTISDKQEIIYKKYFTRIECNQYK
ncbi:hypothetical protein SAMN05444411_1293 [Lutibacter oricola]|uniref:DOD-type homing endonuclease domain-containing protein n=2 Tax=Lutibacter oricola TaxID=762486 RepID=A0A1H3HAW9_9FLAO|nr:hypothetical protein SAMN05444411_1293 [Lutibacter oricola]